MDPAPALTTIEPVTPRPSRRWLWAALLAGLALLGLGALAFVWLGRERLTRQITALVLYEDDQSRLGAASQVLAVLADGDPDWRDQRALETALSLPAPLPAGNLLPTADPAQVVRITARGEDEYEAVVLRRYADSAGVTYGFTLLQRYRRVGPGQWERLPPDLAALEPIANFEGERLSALLPAVDEPWLRPALLAADETLVRVCAEWTTCPPGDKLVLSFGNADSLAHPRATRRLDAPPPGGYPIILDLFPQAQAGDGRYPFPAPYLSGRPADDEAQAAYARALTAGLLGHLAGRVAGAARGEHTYFMDAVAAHAEARLGLSSAQAGQSGWRPYDYVAPNDLWQQNTPLRDGPSGGLPERLQAVGLVALAAPTPEQEGRLLEILRRKEIWNFDTWMTAGLGSDTARRVQVAWIGKVQSALAAAGAADWAQAEGLTLACADGIHVVEGGVARLLLPAEAAVPQLRSGEVLFAQQRLYPGHWSLDGRYLVMTAVYPPRSAVGRPSTGLVVLDRTTGRLASAMRAEGVFELGWSAGGELIYVRYAPEAGDATGMSLFGFNPATGVTRDLLPDSVRLFSLAPSSWSADHGSLALTVSPQPPYTSAAIITLGAASVVRPLGEQGYAFAPVFAPGSTPAGGRAAFLTGAQAGFPVGSWELHVIDLETRAIKTVLKSADLVGGATEAVFALEWSPDGRHIVFQVAPEGRYVAVSPDTGLWRDWTGVPGVPADFSADGRHLIAMESTGVNMLLVYSLLELDAVRDAPAHRFVARGLAWSPAGHRLALANDLGVFLVDPDTQAYSWLGAGACRLSW